MFFITCILLDREVFLMFKKKYHILLDKYEKSHIIYCLNELRSTLIYQGKYTDGVDNLILKIIKAKKIKVHIK